MSEILIETYGGFNIEFNTDSGKFQCICTDDDTKESTSFAAVKKFIDEYQKKNQDFKPFWIEPTPDGYKSGKLKVIGIRKDGRFVAESSKGEKEQIPESNLKGYMIYKPENEDAVNKLSELRKLEEIQRLENNETRRRIISEINITTLKDCEESLHEQLWACC